MNYVEWKTQNTDGTLAQYVETCRANDERADLSGAVLRWAVLRWADLSGAVLRWADLSGADLSDADLSGADLSRADLSDATLRRANLSRADLSDADLRGASGLFTLGAFGRHTAVAAGGYIAIGCERHPYEAWLTQYKEIGRKHGYTADEIADYGAWIKLAVARQRRIEQAD